jgi:hypothetical protein
VVSNSFNMGDWTPDETTEAREGCTSYCKAFSWIVPAKVEGTWRLPQGELRLQQKYQEVSGTLRAKNVITRVSNGKLRGDRISFTLGRTRYEGQVSGNTMQGTTNAGGKKGKWEATAVAQN